MCWSVRQQLPTGKQPSALLVPSLGNGKGFLESGGLRSQPGAEVSHLLSRVVCIAVCGCAHFENFTFFLVPNMQNRHPCALSVLSFPTVSLGCMQEPSSFAESHWFSLPVQWQHHAAAPGLCKTTGTPCLQESSPACFGVHMQLFSSFLHAPAWFSGGWAGGAGGSPAPPGADSLPVQSLCCHPVCCFLSRQPSC